MSGCSIKLEVGNIYVTRNGNIVGPLEFDNDRYFPFSFDSGSWLENGREYEDLETENDIVREHVEPAPQVGETNDTLAGRKDDTGKLPLGLIPREALLAEAAVLQFGAQKYAAHNWRKGMRWSRLGDAAMRHLLASLDGEDLDPETGLPHLAHLRCCAGFLLNYAERKLGEDDRHTASNADT